MEVKKLNIGCGKNVKVGWINLDRFDLPGLDVVHDIENLPLPFDDKEFEEIVCDNVLEHLEYIPVLKDLYRILKPGGHLRIRVPHFNSHTSFGDPTHKKFFSSITFEFFVKDARFEKDYYFDFHFSRIAYRKIKFLKKGLFWGNRLIEPFVNLTLGMQYLYESTLLSRLFPANDIVVELVK